MNTGSKGAVRDRRLTLISIALCALLVIYAVAVMAGNTVKDTAFDVIREKMAFVSESMIEGDTNRLSRNTGVDASGDFLYYMQDSVMDVSELLILKNGDEAALDAAEDAVNAHLKQQIESFENYGTNQSFLLKNAIVWRKAPFLFFAVGENAETWQDAFLSCVK